jgi:hypothetical protein
MKLFFNDTFIFVLEMKSSVGGEIMTSFSDGGTGA